MARILVAGAGCGGLVAAIKLAEMGHNVTVFEKSDKDLLGLEQTDAIDLSAFEMAGIPVDPDFTVGKNTLTIFPPDKSVASITLPPPSEDSVLADRRHLAKHFTDLCEKSGADIIYNSIVKSPIVLGSRVVGIKTDSGDFYGDLVIDACGIDSPLRNNLPSFMNINRQLKETDVLYTYRAYFKNDKTAPQPDTYYNIYINGGGTDGFSWLITEDDKIDVLIASFKPLNNESILKKLQSLYEENPHLSKDFLYGGKFKTIPLCQPLGCLVADGYAAIGDSAFMTYAVKGSGIAYSMVAGKLLADAIENDTYELFNCETLWEYQKSFFKEIGFSACRIVLIKNILPYLTVEEVSEFFKSQIITTDEISVVVTNKFSTLTNSEGRAFLKEKVKLFKNDPILKEKTSLLAVWLGKLTLTEPFLPSKYDRKDVEKWVLRYNEFFDGMKAP